MPTPRGSAEKKATQMAACMAHRRAGRTFDEIAALVGISKTTAHRLTHEALDAYRVKTAADVEEHIALQLARLDAALVAISQRVATGSLDAIDRMIALERRRSALLGLDRPAKVAPTSPDGTQPYEGGGLAEMLAEARQLRKD